MSARGLYGFRVDGEDRLSYNHFDSYPGGLGDRIVKQMQMAIAEYGVDELADLARHVVVVDRDDVPTRHEREKFAIPELARAPDGSAWSLVLAEYTGNLLWMLMHGIMIESNSFISDSLFCEWAFIVNFDDRLFEVYRGFQEKPHTNGRFHDKLFKPSHRVGSEYMYYPCALLLEEPLENIATDWAVTAENMVSDEEEE